MSIDRRKVLALFAAGTASALAGCGGGGDGPATRHVWLLNLNPEFPSADVFFGSTLVASDLPAPGLTSRFEVEFGAYTVTLDEPSTGETTDFVDVVVNRASPSLFVFYRHFDSSRLGSSPPGIINYFDSNVALDVDLFDGDDDDGPVQLETLEFEGSAAQESNSDECTLQLYAQGSSVLVYDSGVQERPDSILIFPRFRASSPRSGEVAVVALNYGSRFADAVTWPNTLG
jgi:hypothetical protein